MELIRPFLRINKTALVGFCREEGLAYAEDTTNLLTQYKRNAVRLELLPMLEQHNPRVRQSLLQLAEIASAEDEYMEANAAKCFDEPGFHRAWKIHLEKSCLCGHTLRFTTAFD